SAYGFLAPGLILFSIFTVFALLFAFEEALARVSRRLAAAARAAARAFKAERIAEARAASFSSPPPNPAVTGRSRRAPREDQVADRAPRTPDRLKRHATTRAATKRAQSRKDSR
ncbi:hypothetical protein AB0H87_11070, partial [Asanoa sp. NPDC050611]